MSRFLTAIAFALVATYPLLATPAAAATGSCTVGAVTYSLSSVAANDANNVFCFSGQPSYAGPAPTETFFGTEYTLSYKSDEPKGDGQVTFSDFITDLETPPATWAINDPSAVALSVIIGLKQKDSYAAFLISSLSGTWSINGGDVNDYSHVDIWYQPGVTPVPVPAALPLFAGGLGLLGWMARRRRGQAAHA